MSQRIHQVVVASFIASALMFLSAAGLRGAGGQVRHVPRDYPTIQSAVAAAEAGDTVLVAAGIYTENVVVSTSGLRLLGSGDVALDGTGLSGIGIHVLGAAAAPVTAVEVLNFEVRNFERGIIVQSADEARVLHNYVHDNVDKSAPVALGDGIGIELLQTSGSDVSRNVISSNGLGGINVRLGSTDNTVRHNRVLENGSQSPTIDGDGIILTGAGGQGNRIEHNKIEGNYGRGIRVARPVGAPPITGIPIAHNQVHRNQRSGIAIMFAATGNTIVHNDARENNLSRLPPCYDCNLFDNSVGKDGGNFWDKKSRDVQRNRCLHALTRQCGNTGRSCVASRDPTWSL